MKKWNPSQGILVVTVAGLVGCAMVNDTALQLVSSRVPALAIVNGQLLSGELALMPDRTGTLSLTGGQGSISNCSGQVRYEASTSGVVDIRCDDGSASLMRYSVLSETRGYGYGATATGVASLTFGLAAVDAKAYLSVPANKKLIVKGDGALELQ